MDEPGNPLLLEVSEEGYVLSFYFDPVFLRNQIKYSVSVFENENKISLFFMEQVNEKWKIINAPQIESRFIKMEALLADFLERNT